MKQAAKKIIQESIDVKSLILKDEKFLDQIEACANMMLSALNAGNKILIFGNGGSAADSQHFAAELVSRFQKERRALAAIALSTDTSILSAIGNDYSFDKIFERQIEAVGRQGDVAFAISTSGRAKNVLLAVKAARSAGMKTIGLTGGKDGELAGCVDLAFRVPSQVTARVQEAHILIIHALCQLVEENL
ncbi:MAG: D-sedoheptulose 7-phosphate isomerase [Candidatus Omnitrophota bacterium]